MRFPCAILVVAIHSDIDGCFLSQCISHVLAHIAVPIFFMISGFLFYKGLESWNWTLWKEKLCKRVMSLLIPYIIWISLYAAYTDTIPTLSDYWCSVQWNFERLDIWGIPNRGTGPILVPMWFIRDLMVCIGISPLGWLIFHKDANNHGRQRRILGLSTLLILYLTQTSLYIPGFSSTSIFYFAVGGFLSLNGKTMDSIIKTKAGIGVISILSAVLFIIEIIYDGHNTTKGNLVYPFFVFTAVLSVIGMTSLLLSKERGHGISRIIAFCSKQSESCFFIFASHLFILPYVGAILQKAIEITSLGTLVNENIIITIFYILRIVIVVTVCVVLYKTMRKLFPRVTTVICGR